MQGNASHVLKFLIESWEFEEINKKTNFFVSFLEVFQLSSLTPYELRPNFLKDLMKIHNRGKFH